VFERHRAKIEAAVPWPTPALRPCQLTTVVYSASPGNSGRSGRRYVGMLGRIAANDGKTSKVELLSSQKKVLAAHDFDLSDPAQCDPDGPLGAGETLLRPSSAKGVEGAIFLEIKLLANLATLHPLESPKVPLGLDE
jgi:hypothetical protein